VEGVFKSSSSCFMTSRRPGKGLLGSSEGRIGKVADLGVLSWGKVGLGDFGVWMVGVGGTGGIWSVEAMVAGGGPSVIGDHVCQMNDSRDTIRRRYLQRRCE